MQLVERFHAEANDGRVVEILKWGPSSMVRGEQDGRGGQAHVIYYSTVEGWRCQPTQDGGYTVIPSGVNLRRVG